MKNKILIINGLIIILIVIVGLNFNYNNKTTNETIKIGAMLPMTGPAGIYGECQYNGALLAVEEANKNGGVNGQKLELLLQDTKGDVKEGVNAYNNIKGQVKTVITAISGIVLSVGPVADKDHVVVMNIGAKSPKISQEGDYVFSTVQNSDADEKVFAQYVKNDLKLNNIAIIAVNNDYGLGTSDAFAKAFISEGGKIIGTEKYEASATDFRTILTKIKVLKPEGVFIVGYKEQGLLLKQATSL
ncbi:MAG: ABC transporter substrate-binding protein, partial [bacterium]